MVNLETATFKERQYEATRIRKKYVDKIPIIIDKDNWCNLPVLDKRKYLVPHDITLGQFIFVLRKRLQLKSAEGIFIFTENNTLAPISTLIGELDNNNVNKDGFLYLKYTKEHVFG
jgi:GABA(A) receptor-associated protein